MIRRIGQESIACVCAAKIVIALNTLSTPSPVSLPPIAKYSDLLWSLHCALKYKSIINYISCLTSMSLKILSQKENFLARKIMSF